MTTEQEHLGFRTFIRTAGEFTYQEAPDSVQYFSANRSEEIVVSPFRSEVEIPPGSSPLIERMMRIAAAGSFLFLTRKGRPIVGIVPAHIAKSLLTDGDDDDDEPGGEFGPVADPTALHGPGAEDFDDWYSLLTELRA